VSWVELEISVLTVLGIVVTFAYVLERIAENIRDMTP